MRLARLDDPDRRASIGIVERADDVVNGVQPIADRNAAELHPENLAR